MQGEACNVKWAVKRQQGQGREGSRHQGVGIGCRDGGREETWVDGVRREESRTRRRQWSGGRESGVLEVRRGRAVGWRYKSGGEHGSEWSIGGWKWPGMTWSVLGRHMSEAAGGGFMVQGLGGEAADSTRG